MHHIHIWNSANKFTLNNERIEGAWGSSSVAQRVLTCGHWFGLQHAKTRYVMWQNIKTGQSRSKVLVCSSYLSMYSFSFSVSLTFSHDYDKCLVRTTEGEFVLARDLRRYNPSWQEGLVTRGTGYWAHSCQWSGRRERWLLCADGFLHCSFLFSLGPYPMTWCHSHSVKALWEHPNQHAQGWVS